MQRNAAAARHSRSHLSRVVICIFLVAITWIVFGQIVRNEFVNYDDNVFVYQNPHVTGGLSMSGLVWAFTHVHSSNWQPLTFLSHMADCQVFGLHAGGHHLVSLLLHTLSVLILFLALHRMTRRPDENETVWRSAFVAALFAIHPLKVESVAWVAERKDVLSGLFFMLTLAAYVHYVSRRSIGRFFPVLLLFGLGLLSKPMLVTMPFVLLLLDYWPMNRLPAGAPDRKLPWSRLFLEKIPLFLLSVASSWVTFFAQENALGSIKHFSLGSRISNALVSYATYIAQMFWPMKLIPFYPYPKDQLPGWKTGLAAASLILFTVAVLAIRKRRPYLVTGWFWYLGMLVPVIGLVQVGLQGHADRYTYLPQIGLSIALTWWVADISTTWPYRKQILAAAATAAIVCLGLLSWVQTSFWRDSETLWTHALALNSQNAVAHNGLGSVFFTEGLTDRAIAEYQKALDLRPGYGEAQFNLGNVLSGKSDLAGAIMHYRRATEIQPYDATAQYNLANSLRRIGNTDEAERHYQKAIALAPDNEQAHYNYANLLREKNRLDEAILQYQQVLGEKPNDADAHNNLGLALVGKGRIAEAVSEFEQALRIKPGSTLYLNNLAWQLATSPDPNLRNAPRAIELANRANQLCGGKNPIVLHTLAAAYAANGQFPQAIQTVQAALHLAAAQGNNATAAAWEKEIELYRAGLPYRETGP